MATKTQLTVGIQLAGTTKDVGGIMMATLVALQEGRISPKDAGAISSAARTALSTKKAELDFARAAAQYGPSNGLTIKPINIGVDEVITFKPKPIKAKISPKLAFKKKSGR